jgi:hypothetical protein
VGNILEKVDVRVIAEKMKICSYLHVEKILIRKVFPKGWTIFKCL